MEYTDPIGPELKDAAIHADLIGSELDGFRVTSASLILEMMGPARLSFDMFTMVDICPDESSLFHPFSDYSIASPETISALHSVIGEELSAVELLGRNRVCRVVFESRSFFVWAKPNKLPRNLFRVQRYNKAEPDGWWGIDDV